MSICHCVHGILPPVTLVPWSPSQKQTDTQTEVVKTTCNFVCRGKHAAHNYGKVSVTFSELMESQLTDLSLSKRLVNALLKEYKAYLWPLL